MGIQSFVWVAFSILAVLLQPSSTSSSSSPTAFTWTIDIDLPFDEQILAYTLQGLANRDSARVWYYNPGFWTYNESTYWFPPNYLTPNKGYTFTPFTSFCDLFTALTTTTSSTPLLINGLALYDGTILDASRWLAVTSSGLDNLLPVSTQILSNSTYATCLSSLPVKVDYRNHTGFSTNLEAYDYMLQTLFPRVNKTFIYSAGHSYNDSTEYVYLGNDLAIDMGLDIAVQLQAAVFNLSPDTSKYAAQAAKWAELEAALNQGKLVFGWAEPEPAMTMATSLVGGAVVCDAAPNLSFWTHVSSTYPVLPYNAPLSAKNVSLDPTAYYVTFQTNEGDTPKILAALQGGVWIDPRRGNISIAWGIDPLVSLYAPGLLEFYASTATPMDSFFAATAGAGYAYPWVMSPSDFQFYVTRAKNVIQSITPSYPPNTFEVDIWDSNILENLTSYKEVTGSTVGMFSMQPESLAGTNSYLPDGTPVVIGYKSLWYPCQNSNGSTFDEMEATLRSIIAENKPPYFTVVYGCLDMSNSESNYNMFDFALTMQERLGDSLNMKIIGMQDMALYARQAHEMNLSSGSGSSESDSDGESESKSKSKREENALRPTNLYSRPQHLKA